MILYFYIHISRIQFQNNYLDTPKIYNQLFNLLVFILQKILHIHNQEYFYWIPNMIHIQMSWCNLGIMVGKLFYLKVNLK
jgi:hypothetical protein